MIALIDYGLGNLKSVYNAFSKLGHQTVVTQRPQDINNSDLIILPGVGAFKDAIDNLNKLELIDCLRKNAQAGKPVLGICLGMQLLFDRSYEDGEWKGLGLLQGDIVPFKVDKKVPHMGWNNLVNGITDPIREGVEEGEYVYFVHSYYLEAEKDEEVVFWTDYGVRVPALVRKDNIIGMQFHPEKSSEVGMKLLRNFGELRK